MHPQQIPLTWYRVYHNIIPVLDEVGVDFEGARFLFVLVACRRSRCVVGFGVASFIVPVSEIKLNSYPIAIYHVVSFVRWTSPLRRILCYKFGVNVEKNTSVAASLSMALPLYIGIVDINHQHIYIKVRKRSSDIVDRIHATKIVWNK